MDQQQPLLGASIFESINLETSAHPIGNHTRNTDVPRIPGSDSTSDEDGLDPTEFLSSQNRLGELPEEPEPTSESTMGRLRSPTIPDHEFFLNPSRILNQNEDKGPENSLQSTLLQASASISGPGSFKINTFDFSRSQSNESPLDYLQNRQKALHLETRKNIAAHRTALEDQNLPNRLRSMLAQNLEQLSDNYVSLQEVYSRNRASTEDLLTSFEKWDRKRAKILAKIQDIKSQSNKHGTKLATLLDERSVVDNEINELEQKLLELRLTRRLLDTEVEKTSSVLESRSAKYVESFRTLEKHGEHTIRQYLELNGVPEKEVPVMLRREIVDVTFTNHYNRQLKQLKPPLEPAVAKKASPSALTMGIQPFIIPDEPVSVKDEDLNHDKGPTAYEKGFARGTKQSSEVKGNLQLFLTKLMANKEPKRAQNDPKLNVDDTENTITEKIDLEPIVKHLYHNIEALEALELQTSKKTTLFHEHSIVWKDAIKVIKLQEAKLLQQITESQLATKEENQSRFLSILGATFNHLHSSIKTVPRPLLTEFLTENVVFNALLNELSAVAKALSLVSEDKGFASILSGYEGLGFQNIYISPRTSYQNVLMMSNELLEEPIFSTWEDRQTALSSLDNRRISSAPRGDKTPTKTPLRPQTNQYSALSTKLVKKE